MFTAAFTFIGASASRSAAGLALLFKLRLLFRQALVEIAHGDVETLVPIRVAFSLGHRAAALTAGRVLRSARGTALLRRSRRLARLAGRARSACAGGGGLPTLTLPATAAGTGLALTGLTLGLALLPALTLLATTAALSLTLSLRTSGAALRALSRARSARWAGLTALG